jgi:hypothetical protein
MLAACAPSSTQGPAAWIEQPLDGSTLPLQPQEITAHGSDVDGVTSLQFYVDGTLLARKPVGGGPLEHATVAWDPSRPGVYRVTVAATDSQGNVGPEALAVVTVGEVVSPSVPTPSVELSSSPMPPTLTPRPSETVPPPPTSTVVPPTGTPLPPTSTAEPASPTAPPPPPTIVSLVADPERIQEGECTTIGWRVEGGPTEIYFDGEGATSPDSRDRCPSQTTSYTLVARGPGGEASASVTVTVIEAPTPTTRVSTNTPEPADTTPPSIANVSLSQSKLHTVAHCGSQSCACTLIISARVTDESGVWAVVAELKLDGSPKGTLMMSQSSPDFYEAEVGPFTEDGNLVITIIAQDFAGKTAEMTRNVTVWDSCIG